MFCTLFVFLCFWEIILAAVIPNSTITAPFPELNATNICIGPHLQRASLEAGTKIKVPDSNLRFKVIYFRTALESPPGEAIQTLIALLQIVRSYPQQVEYVAVPQDARRYWYSEASQGLIRATIAALIPIPAPVGPDPALHPLLFQEAAIFLSFLVHWLSIYPTGRAGDFTYLLERVTAQNVVTNVATGGICTAPIEASNTSTEQPDLT